MNSSQFNLKTNVRLTMIDKFGRKYDEFIGSNRVTKLALEGLVKFANGEFNPTVPNSYSDMLNYVPSYIAFGSNILTSSDPTTISTSVSVNDYALLSEYKDSNNKYMRFKISSSNIKNSNNSSYIKLTLRGYISSTLLDNKPIREVGLFSLKDGNNCWARIVLPNDKQLIKSEGSVVDVTWELTFISVESQNISYTEFSGSRNDLNELINSTKNYSANDYQVSAWNKFINIDIQYAYAILYYSNASEDVIKDEISRLTKAIDELNKSKI